jgi:hypothetical protein
MRLTIEGTFGGEPVIIGLGFISNSGLADMPADLANLVNEFAPVLDIGNSTGIYLSPLSAQYKVTGLRAQDLNPGVAASVVQVNGAVGGNAVDDAMPPNDALCVTWRTGLKGKQNRGRSYLTGFAEDSNNAGYWIPEIQTWAQDGFAQPILDAFGPVGSLNYTLALIHTQAGGTPLIPPTATPIQSFTVNNNVRSLRRRATGVRISRHRTTP